MASWDQQTYVVSLLLMDFARFHVILSLNLTRGKHLSKDRAAWVHCQYRFCRIDYTSVTLQMKMKQRYLTNEDENNAEQ